MSTQLFWQLLITLGCLFNQGQGANAHKSNPDSSASAGTGAQWDLSQPSAGVVQLWAISDARFGGLSSASSDTGSSWHRLFLASCWKELYLVLRQAFPPGTPGELRTATRHGLLGQNFSCSPDPTPCPLVSAMAGLALSPSASTSLVLHYSFI